MEKIIAYTGFFTRILLVLVLIGSLSSDALGRASVKRSRSASKQVEESTQSSALTYLENERLWNPFRSANAGSAGNADAVPNKLFLDQNFPNPFNPTTMIRYGIPTNAYVKITVHTLLGTQVRVLVDQWQEAGIYTYDFAANDLPSGAYFYRLQTSFGTATRRMMISK